MFYTKGRFISNFNLFAKSLILYSEYSIRKIEYSFFATDLFDAIFFGDSDSDNILYEIL